MTDIDISDIERELSENRLQAKNRKAEVTGIEAVEKARAPSGAALGVRFESIAGDEIHDVLPVFDGWDEDSDLVALIEFTEADPNDLRTLVGKRVPTTSYSSVDYSAMKQALRSQAAAAADWDFEKRMEKALEVGDD